MTAMPPAGGHQFAPTFSGGPGAVGPAVPRMPLGGRPRGVVLGLLSAAVIVVGLAAAQVSANLGYDAAAEEHRVAAATAAGAKADLRVLDAELVVGAESARLILGDDDEAIVMDPAARDAFAAAASEAEDVSSQTETLLATPIPSAGDKPDWFWELFGLTSALETQTADAVELAADAGEHSADVADAAAAVTTSGLAVLVDVAEAATGFEAQHPSARNDAVIALREATEAAAAVVAVDEEAVSAYSALQEAAAQVVSTEAAELAEKAGPLQGARLEIEAFARSLAPGVLLEFDWAVTVNGAGDNGSMGGYTTWWWDDPGRAVIELSDSVAEQWPAERSKALVAHEVGHAISVKCQDMYDSSTQDSIEKWATAWAISMGFTDDANGVWAYGYPPQNYIDAAARCR